MVIARHTVRSVEELDDVLGPDAPPARVAVEACRKAWSVHDRLRNAGHEPVLVDTTRVKQIGIGAHGRKTDRIDAEVLARALPAMPTPRKTTVTKKKARLGLTSRRIQSRWRARGAYFPVREHARRRDRAAICEKHQASRLSTLACPPLARAAAAAALASAKPRGSARPQTV